MIKKFSGLLPAVIFLILIVGVGYLIWVRPTPVPPSIPESPQPVTPNLNPTPIPPTPTTGGAEVTRLPSVALTPSAILATSTPTSPPRIVIPAPTYTPTPDVSPEITGIVIPENLNVRWGPGGEYGYVGAVYQGDEVVILGRTPATDWLEIKTPDGKQGWVARRFIGNIEGALSPLPVVLANPPPPSPPIGPAKIIPLDMNGKDVAGSMIPGQERWYSFFDTDKETVFVLIFRPNFKGVQFSVLDQGQSTQWPVVGVGSVPASDRDGDLNTGELVWRGGPLVADKTYYLRLINNSQTRVEYCLAPRDEYQEKCSSN